ncbi:1,2-phenylacetyl-CoA epoxidase subunit PaaC [Bacillus suaedaesalsae]|uniref:Phenylacetate-CoA oxygenase subunit PaaC n=1 Tax=Bacillus suaedaesalsae TaxID=2810349 RepID=A0ABS2DLP2_9BACI|nr:1,2-phenylacetyl-CoA epoxidase subunit PaaC [Bacillus suaedaesalsae]MBM6619405.1 phenylacetate-CoA oxygenase subunit PaaC [Bacillus suaedaesalsae]
MSEQSKSISNPIYKEALTELLFQLADDDFIVAFRGSEWLGLAPHIEEDVAFSSISQDTMGHAAIFYKLLEDIGAGDMDYLAHARQAEDRRNSIMLEEVNGTGTYLSEPHFDWAFAVVRHYFYTQAKKIRIDSLKNSSYQPLAEAAVKVNMELYYHLLHWKTWFQELVKAGGEARERMEQAVKKVSSNLGDLFLLGDQSSNISSLGLIEGEEQIKQRWVATMTPVFENLQLQIPLTMEMEKGNGRIGQHTKDLEVALTTLSEVYNINPAANW